jgi:serine/threonine-protein kinase
MRFNRSWSLAFLSLLLAAPLLANPRLAAAEEQAVSPARSLFDEGRKLVEQGKYEEACPKFEQSLRLEVGIGTQFNLANCWEHVGRTASAHALFLGAAASAKAAGQAEREQVLRDRATALEPRLSRLVIEIAGSDPKLTVKRNDLPIEADTFGRAIAVDPGKYVISAKAPGKKSWERTVEISPSTTVLTVQVPELETLAAPKPAAAPAPKKPAPRKPPAPPPSDIANDRPGPNYKALAVGGFGVGALVFGTVMGLKYKSANDDAKAICPTSRNCTIQDIEDHGRFVDDATTARSWSYAGFTVGVVGLGAAAALWVFEQPEPSRTAFRALPVVGPDGSAGLMLRGTY